jgi:DNA-directed RNA polymerase specialized sigma24 family protein
MNGLPLATVLPAALASSAADRLAALFDAHHQRLYRLAVVSFRRWTMRWTLVQETFVRAARKPTSIPIGFADEEAWLVRVLVNIRRDQWRKADVRNRFAGESLRASAVATHPEASSLRAATSGLHSTRCRRGVAPLSYYHELEGLTIQDVASMLGISAITVRWHLSKGRRELLKILKTVQRRNMT